MATLFEKIGGSNAVSLAVDRFYDRVLNDDRVKHFFEGLDMNKQREHQRDFLTYAFGGAPHYDGRPMRKAHQKLVEEQGLTGEHFDAIAEDLVLTLQEIGVSQELIDEVVAIAGAPHHRRDILNE